MAALLFCVLGANGQDYTGIYYIANAIWNADNNTSEYYWYSVDTPEYNWYLVPGADPQLEHYSDAYFNNQYSNTNSGGTADYTGSNYGDPEKPFLTTYRTNRDRNSIWIVKKTGDYYYIIHALTGKYIKYERTYKSFATRKTMHLEDVDGDAPGNVFQYVITTNTNSAQSITGFNISSRTLTDGNRHFNPAGDNHPRYYGTNDGNKTPYSSGMVGIWTANADMIKGCLWPYEDASATLTPIVTDNGDRTVTISMPTGYEIYDIYYTTDGSTPDASSAHATGSVTISDLPADYYGWIKAKAGRVGVLTTTTASLFVDFTTIEQPTMSVSGCDNSITLSCTSPETSIYYTLDGSEPTNASTLFTEPFYAADGTTVKSIAYRYTNHSAVATQTVVYSHTSLPTITFSLTTLKCILACPDNDATIYYTYTTDGNEPVDPVVGNPSQAYSAPINIPQNVTFWIKAVAKNNNLEASCVVGNSIALSNIINDLASLQGVSGNNHYLVVADINASGLQNSIAGFSGTLESLVKEDGTFYTISGLNKPLFASTDGATIRNLTFDNVNITSGTNVGTLVAEADGNTRIYNVGVLGGSVSGSNNVGGLVGLIKENSSVRVVNCYSYADVSGGTYAAGIVGKNEGTVASGQTVGNVRIALCMMYGSVSGATNISPVYGGNHVGNVQNYTEYNFYLYSNERDDDGNKIEKIPYTVYNDQQAITEEEYLTRFPFHRHILNTHRELGAFFLFGASTSSDVNSITSDEISEIGHWVVKKDIAPYPIVEPWGTNTKKVLNAPTPSNILTEMGTNGYLSVTVNISADGMASGSSAIQTTITLPITDMDEANYDYTWGKVVLPFANEFRTSSNEVWTPDYSKICTGWKITSVTKGSTPYTTYSATNYNFADRDNPQKDIYQGDNLFIFAQGGNYIVPYGVTAITIEANFANAIYLSDATYDVGYTTSYKEPTGLGGNVLNGGNFHGKTVHHNITAALGAASATNTPHTQAIVLVGNYHFPSTDNPNNDYLDSYKTKAFTLMSIDADNNQEPDYAFYSNSTLNRPKVPPMRIDFVALVPLGMAAHVNSSKYYPGLPIWNTRGWFEMTETSLCWANQFELASSQFNLDATDGKKYNRLIINSGYFVQMVRASKTNSSTGSNGSCQKLVYSQIGGNTYIKEYYPGSHSATPKTTTLVPVNVTGGEIEQCFMTGYGYKETGGVGNYGTVVGDNIYFWCAGGKIGKFLGAYMENPVPVTPGGKVNMTAKIDHALITEFYGGGTSPEAPITGKIDVTIKNSRVDRYCGGPEFGDMTPGETVTTRATNTTFGYFYGAGFGGTGITYYTYEDYTQTIRDPNSYTTTLYPDSYFATHYSPGDSNHGRLKVKNGGIGTCYKFEYIVNTSVLDRLVARFYVGFAKFDLATTGNVTNELTDCTILYDFYGAGCQGKVAGTVTSTLTDCTVNGNAYGAGYKATANDVKVYPTTDPKNSPYALSKYTMATGIFSEFHIPDPVIFQWKPGEAGGSNDDNHELYTDKPMNTLGDVSGAITLTLDGNTVVYENVFGGGNESKSLDDATVIVKGSSEVRGNVFGGGNKAAVEQNTTVKLQEGVRVLGNVYGGGNEGPVGGDSEVLIQNESGTTPEP